MPRLRPRIAREFVDLGRRFVVFGAERHRVVAVGQCLLGQPATGLLVPLVQFLHALDVARVHRRVALHRLQRRGFALFDVPLAQPALFLLFPGGRGQRVHRGRQPVRSAHRCLPPHRS